MAFTPRLTTQQRYKLKHPPHSAVNVTISPQLRQRIDAALEKNPGLTIRQMLEGCIDAYVAQYYEQPSTIISRHEETT